MRKYLTSYYLKTPSRNIPFSSYLWAETDLEAERLCASRGIGERVDGWTVSATPSVPMPGDAQFPHWLIFLAWVALRAGHSPDLLSDVGILHEAAHEHYKIEGEINSRVWYVGLCRELGFLPPVTYAP